jgi:hypothetical protein
MNLTEFGTAAEPPTFGLIGRKRGQQSEREVGLKSQYMDGLCWCMHSIIAYNCNELSIQLFDAGVDNGLSDVRAAESRHSFFFW